MNVKIIDYSFSFYTPLWRLCQYLFYIIAFSGLYEFSGYDISIFGLSESSIFKLSTCDPLLLLFFYGFLLKLIRQLLHPLLMSFIGLEAFCLYITFYRCGTGAALSLKDKQLES